jgi:hypothetical protein
MVVLIGVRMCVPDVVIMRIVEQVIDQAVAVGIVDRAVGEHEALEPGKHGVARRTIDVTVFRSRRDGGVDQAEVERDRVDAVDALDELEACGACKLSSPTCRTRSASRRRELQGLERAERIASVGTGETQVGRCAIRRRVRKRSVVGGIAE